mmetsp:Transcript_19327/g.33157  ORF Transcript_19327/g.33157 Transcript_19327/m.33157 type:complete len:257 (+) Transcript_19327:1249-2019(+)
MHGGIVGLHERLQLPHRELMPNFLRLTQSYSLIDVHRIFHRILTWTQCPSYSFLLPSLHHLHGCRRLVEIIHLDVSHNVRTLRKSLGLVRPHHYPVNHPLIETVDPRRQLRLRLRWHESNRLGDSNRCLDLVHLHVVLLQLELSQLVAVLDALLIVRLGLPPTRRDRLAERLEVQSSLALAMLALLLERIVVRAGVPIGRQDDVLVLLRAWEVERIFVIRDERREDFLVDGARAGLDDVGAFEAEEYAVDGVGRFG